MLVLVVVVLAAGPPRAPQNDPNAPGVDPNDLARLRWGLDIDPNAFRRLFPAEVVAVDRASASRAEAVRMLMRAVEQAPEPNGPAQVAHTEVRWAMLKLGELHAVEAVPLLLRRAELMSPAGVQWDIYADRYVAWPALQALSQMGMPAAVGILKSDVLAAAPDYMLHRYALVIRDVFPDKKTALAFVDAYDPGYTAEARTKLVELRKQLANWLW
jgi:hypothetical protein